VSLKRFLSRHRRIAIDTCVFIYQLEGHPKYSSPAETVFEWLEQRGHTAVTSTVTMLDLLVQPYRQGDLKRVDQIYALLTTFPNLEWIASSVEVSDLAARLRADHNLRTPDAVQAATALDARATAIVTNDPAFERVSSIAVAVLDRFAQGV
jgi:predicted nucleic acid-binding protein